MELRQNVYFILLYALITGMLILSSAFIYVKIKDMGKNIALYKSIYGALQKSLNVYYSGSIYEYKDNILYDYNCFSRYDSKMRSSIYCNDKKLILFSLNYPLLMNIHEGNNQIYVERGTIDYSIFKYFYVLVTNKRIIFIRFNIDGTEITTDKINNLLTSFFLNLPTSAIIAFYDNNKYMLMCRSEELEKCDKHDFMSFVLFSTSIGEFITNIDVNLRVSYSPDIIEHIRLQYGEYAPIFIAVVDNENDCGVEENCLIYDKNNNNFPLRYIYKNKDGTKVEWSIHDGYEILLLTLFKEMYGIYDEKNHYFELEEDNYRQMWIDYISFYAPILSKRYLLLKEKKEYLYNSYTICKSYFNQISQKFCSDNADSLCRISNNENDQTNKINNLYRTLSEIIDIGKDIIAKGCEEMVFL